MVVEENLNPSTSMHLIVDLSMGVVGLAGSALKAVESGDCDEGGDDEFVWWAVVSVTLGEVSVA